jgi:glutamyl-tRNA reductase
MQIGVLGISCKSAPLALLEKIAKAALHLSSQNIVLSTCHRTEIYFSANDLAACQADIFQHLKPACHSYEHAFYSFFGVECFYHLACVTSGLDSLLLAESDIQRQVKVAYETARQNYLPSPLHFLFQKSLKTGKDARSQFPLFQKACHLESILHDLTCKLLGPTPRLLFVGNSDINRKIIHTFWRKGHRNMTLSTRTLTPALPFAVDYHLTLRDRQEIALWTTYDAVICATTAPTYLLTPIHNPHTRLILDLSVPRVAHPALNDLPTLTLLNMEEIAKFFENHQNSLYTEAVEVKKFLQSTAQSHTTRYAQKAIELNRQFF